MTMFQRNLKTGKEWKIDICPECRIGIRYTVFLVYDSKERQDLSQLRKHEVRLLSLRDTLIAQSSGHITHLHLITIHQVGKM